MACARTRFTGKIGACMPTSGPGAAHLANQDAAGIAVKGFTGKPAETREHRPGAGR